MQVLLDGIQILGPMNLVKTFGSEFVVMQMVVAQLRLVAARKSVRRSHASSTTMRLCARTY